MTKRSEAADERAIKNQFVKRKKILDRLYKYAARNNISIFRPDLEQVIRFRRRLRGGRPESYTCFLGQTVITTMHENVEKGAFCRPITCSRCNNGFVNRHRQQGVDRLDGERFRRIQPCDAITNKLLVVPFNIEHSPSILDIPAHRGHMETIMLVKTLQVGPQRQERHVTPRMPVRSIQAMGVPNPNARHHVTIFWSIVDRARQAILLPVANQELSRVLNREAERQGEELINGILVSDIRVMDARGDALDIRALYLYNHWVLLDTTAAVSHAYGEQENENYVGEAILGERGQLHYNPVAREIAVPPPVDPDQNMWEAVPPPALIVNEQRDEVPGRALRPPEYVIREQPDGALDFEDMIDDIEHIEQDYEIDEPPEDVPLPQI